MGPLSKGITGFSRAMQEPRSSMRAFSAACFEGARALNGRVVSTREADMCNFHEPVLSLQHQGLIRVLCNAYSPLVAFASPRANESDIDLAFVDCVPMASSLKSPWTVFTMEELQMYPTPEVLALLGEEELHEVNYWKPKTVGQVIFNFWD